MKSLTALPTLSAALALVLLAAAPAADAQGLSTPRSTVNAPTSRMLATDAPVPVDLTLSWPAVDLTRFTYSARVAVAVDPAPRDVVDTFPLTADPAGPAHQTGTASDGVGDSRWASRPGTYFIGVEAHPKDTGPRCTTDPATGVISCGQPSLAVIQERPLHEVVVVARLTERSVRNLARRRAGRIGWRSLAPMTCVAPYVSYAYTCTFRWHVGRARKLVTRALTVAQDTTTGRVTIRHA